MAYHEAGVQSETAGLEGRLLAYFRNGAFDPEEVNFRKVKDIGMMLNVTCCDDWEQVMEG